jgi:3-oxoadipate enol-lactonase
MIVFNQTRYKASEKVKMHTRINDIQINYEIEGPAGAPWVAMSHALAATSALWDFQMSALRDAYRVLRFDTRGHGGSSAPLGAYTMEMLAADVVGLLDRLDIRRTHFVGISMGGMIGQVLACRYPDRLEKLVLCDTTCRSDPAMIPAWEERIGTAESEGMKALADQTLERWLSDEFRRNRPEVVERVKSMILNTPVAGFVGCGRAISTFDVSEELANVTAPTLIVVGEKDGGTPVSSAEEIQRKITGSHLEILPRARHLSILEAAEIFNRKLIDFLA